MREITLLLTLVFTVANIITTAQRVTDIPRPTISAPTGVRIIEPQAPPSNLFVEGTEGPVIDLTAIGFAGAKPGVEECGRYFRYLLPSNGEQGQFLLVTETKTPRGLGAQVFTWASDKFHLRVIEGQNFPKVKILHKGGPIYPWAVITISKEDLEKAPCLNRIRKVS